MDFANKIAERLKLLRADHNMTMKDVAAATNIAWQDFICFGYLSGIESS